jgi:hypothetical protein
LQAQAITRSQGLDDVAYRLLTRTGATLSSQMIAGRYEPVSKMLTSFEEWGEIFGYEVMAAALIDLPHPLDPRQQLPDAPPYGAAAATP